MVSKKNYAKATGEGVVAAMGSVSINKAMVEYFVNRQEEWEAFGKMNSHLYRQQLFNKMEEKKLSGESMMLVYAMASIIKSQPRIVQAMTDLPENERFTSSGVWFAVRSFFESDTVQYVTQAKKTKKFPVVNIPNTMPGFDILWFCLCTKDEDRILDNLKVRPTFTQISLKADVQTIAKEGYEIYWTKIVKGSRNPDNKGGAVEAPGMKEDYYQTSAGDSYKLISLTKDNTMNELKAAATDGKYSKEEVEAYLRSFDRSTST
jgi:hypothetical protein